MKKWELSPDVPGHVLTKYGDIVRRMLFDRGIASEDTAEVFLHPSYESLLDPYLFCDMEKAVVRIFEAMEAKHTIVVYSDYDCDGIPAATIMSDFFKKIGYDNVRFYIPHRHDEGYGLHMDAVKDFVTTGAKLLLTFDLGVTAVAETAYAMANGLDVIITDHHLPHGELPRAFAIINPHVDEQYPEKVLSGAGVAFKLVQGFIKKYGEFYKIHEGWEKWLLDVAALGTLSDMVPIRGENRIISYFGMKVLRRNNRPGLRALFSKMKMDTEHLTEDDLTFMVAPRINAASRMDSPIRAFELLASDTHAQAVPLAEHLSKINDDRKLLVARIMKEAKSHVAKRSEESSVIVVGSTGWSAGILGLVAGKLADELGKPVFVWGMEEDDEHIKGSCRSDGTVNVVDMMTANTDYFVQFGGHMMAGGFVATREKIHFLENALTETYVAMQKNAVEVAEVARESGETSAPQHVALATITLDKVTPRFIEDIDRFAPFGLDNPKPIFLFQNVTLDAAKQFGKTKEHLEIMVSDSTGSTKAIAFFKSIDDFIRDVSVERVRSGHQITLVGTLEVSYFRGREARIRIVDILLEKA